VRGVGSLDKPNDRSVTPSPPPSPQVERGSLTECAARLCIDIKGICSKWML
jgi:hypothetical protein